MSVLPQIFDQDQFEVSMDLRHFSMSYVHSFYAKLGIWQKPGSYSIYLPIICATDRFVFPWELLEDIHYISNVIVFQETPRCKARVLQTVPKLRVIEIAPLF